MEEFSCPTAVQIAEGRQLPTSPGRMSFLGKRGQQELLGSTLDSLDRLSTVAQDHVMTLSM